MPDTHSGRVAVVTGAAAGIGQAICRQLAKRGADVVVVDVAEPAQTLEQVAQAGHEGFGIRADVSDPDQTRHVGEQVLDRYGRCDILVNNADIYPN
jgi:NAD(P)-dependent dehydrogenase (short-subunit alcohol dehydrogenase family)